MEFDMNDFFLVVGLFGVLVGLTAYYLSSQGRPNALGRFARPAAGFIVVCGMLLLLLAFV
jgi:hypothetical protein